METEEITGLIRRHAGLIRKIAHAYCRNAADREDVVQEVAVRLWRSRDRYDARFRETTWVYRIALNVAISFHRRERRHREGRVPVDVHEAPIAAEPEASPGEDLALLFRCVDELGALDKALVLLHLDGNDHSSIADVLGISVSNVGTKLHRVKDKLRAAFERHGARPNGTEGPHGTR